MCRISSSFIHQYKYALIFSRPPVSLLSALGLTGGPRVAFKGTVIGIIFGLSVVPEVTNLLH